MSKQKIRSNSFNCLVCGKIEKKIRRNKEFQLERGNLLSFVSSAAERMVLPGGSKLEKKSVKLTIQTHL